MRALESVPPATFDDVYRDRYEPLARLAYLLTGGSPAAEELVQDAFVRAHARWQHIDDPAAYLRTAVVNACTSWQRRAQLERETAPTLYRRPRRGRYHARPRGRERPRRAARVRRVGTPCNVDGELHASPLLPDVGVVRLAGPRRRVRPDRRTRQHHGTARAGVIPVTIAGDDLLVDLAGLTPGARGTFPRTPEPTIGPSCI